jgi:parallel beta-helix repeat protein
MTTYIVSNLNDSGAGSLRAAITAADAATGTSSTIEFSVSGTIALASDLPDITQKVTIDATTAPGAAAGGAPVVNLDFNGHSGLTFAVGSNGSSLLGVAAGGASGNGVTIESSGVTIAGDYVGLTSSGIENGNGGAGIYIAPTSSNNVIGSNPSAASGVVSNVISGNAGNGIVIDGSSGNTLVDNYVGTDPTGTLAIANGGAGIVVTGGATNNLIGGTAYTDTATGAVNNPTGTENTVTPVIVTPPLGNLVSGNGGDGILINDSSENNVLSGNFIGTTASGTSALGNSGDGVAINNANNNSLIGCTALDDPFVYYNVVSGNGANGLHITDSDDTTVQANFFGIGADNATIVGNGLNGILVDGSSSNTQVGGVIPLGNVSAGNGENGIEVAGTASHFISFNTFGGLFAFGGAAPNGNDGILVTSTGGFNTLQTNVLSGNANNGIEIGGNASGVTVDPNIAGLSTDGTSTLSGGGNANNGLEIDGTAHDNIIGGDQQSVIPENDFSGNAAYGVEITGSAYDNQVFASNIGVDVLGDEAFGNGEGGILVSGEATGNTIGGTAASGVRVADVISGNDGNGITLGPATSSTTITNNIIGYGALGIQPIPNAGLPIVPGASTGNTIADNQTLSLLSLWASAGVSPAIVAAFLNGLFTTFKGSGTLGGGTAVVQTGSGTVAAGTSTTAIADASTGNNVVTATTTVVIAAASGDTVSATGSATLLGAASGQVTFTVSGANSSVVGGAGPVVGVASGANTTLIGGSGVSLFSVTGANTLVVAGPSGTTGVDMTQSTGPETVAMDRVRCRPVRAAMCSVSSTAMPVARSPSSASTRKTIWPSAAMRRTLRSRLSAAMTK